MVVMLCAAFLYTWRKKKKKKEKEKKKKKKKRKKKKVMLMPTWMMFCLLWVPPLSTKLSVRSSVKSAFDFCGGNNNNNSDKIIIIIVIIIIVVVGSGSIYIRKI